MTSDRIFNALAAHLASQAQAARGIFARSETVAETMGMLAAAPLSWRCILQWQREDDMSHARGVMRVRFLVIVQQAKGLGIDKGADVTVSTDGRDALLKRFHQVAGWVRGIRFTNEDCDQQPMALLSAYWLADPTFPTRQIAGEFATSYGLDPVPLTNITIP